MQVLEELGITDYDPFPFERHQHTDRRRKVYFRNLHGYWPAAGAWDQIDPSLGSHEDFDALMQALKRSDIKPILDVVLNHVGPLEDPRAPSFGVIDSQVISRHNGLLYNYGPIDPTRWSYWDLLAHRVSPEDPRDVTLNTDALKVLCEYDLCDLPTIAHRPDNPITRAALKAYGDLIDAYDFDVIRIDGGKHMYAQDIAFFIRELAARGTSPKTFIVEYLYPETDHLPILNARIKLIQDYTPGITVKFYDIAVGRAIRESLLQRKKGFAMLKKMVDMETRLGIWGKGPVIIEDHDPFHQPLQLSLTPEEHALAYELATGISQDGPIWYQSFTRTHESLTQELEDAQRDMLDMQNGLYDLSDSTLNRGLVKDVDQTHVNYHVVKRLNDLRTRYVSAFAAKHVIEDISHGNKVMHVTFVGGGKKIHFIANLQNQELTFSFDGSAHRKLLYETPTVDGRHFRFNSGINKPLIDARHYILRPNSSVFIVEENG